MKALPIFAAFALAACAPYSVEDFEPTRAHFLTHQSEFEALVAKIRLCDKPLPSNEPRLWKRECNSGEVSIQDIRRDAKRLGIKRATWGKDYSWIHLVNGEDGGSPLVPMSDLGVMSAVVWLADPKDAADSLEQPLTQPPDHWFYTQHD